MRAIKPIRLAVVTETYPPDVNGVAISLSRLVGGLLERGHHIYLYRVRPRDSANRSESSVADSSRLRITELTGVPIPFYPELMMGLPAGRLLVRRWRSEQPDLVHIATEGPLGWSALRAARRLGIPVSSDFRTQFDQYSTHYDLAWLAAPVGACLRAFHNRTDLTTVPTSALKQELGNRGFRKLRVLGRGVDSRQFDPVRRCDSLRAGWGANPDTPVALCVGRLAAEKNLELAIEAYRAMRDLVTDTKLVFVGDGPLRETLTKACPAAIFAGRQTGIELARYYASADVFLFPSLSETFGNVVTESMASGLATVAFRHAAAADLIESGVTGWLSDPEDARSFINSARA
ncbi:MAG: glycosyltransferase family 4 protein, partial [Betaproteobacteria bacterium]